MQMVVADCTGTLVRPGRIAVRYVIQSLFQLRFVWVRITFFQEGASSSVVACCRIAFLYVPSGIVFRSHVVVSLPGVILIACKLLLRHLLRSMQLQIVAHASLMVLAALPVSLLFVAFVIWAARNVDSRGMPASFSRIRLSTARYAPRILRRFLFWRTSSFQSTDLREVAMPCGEYHAAAPQAIIGLTTDEYTSRAVLKLTPDVEVEMRSIANDCDVCLWITLAR